MSDLHSGSPAPASQPAYCSKCGSARSEWLACEDPECGQLEPAAPAAHLANLSLHELRLLRIRIEREIVNRGGVIDGRNI